MAVNGELTDKMHALLLTSHCNRSCIGKHFAIIEMKAVLSKLIREFDFIDPYPELKEIETTVILTQKPKHGVFIGLERRVH